MSTYPLLAPVDRVPYDVVAALMVRTQRLWDHHVVLGQPYLHLLVPSPVAIRPVSC